MAKQGTLDKYANLAAVSVTESAINTQTATKFAFPFSIMDKMGLVIHRLEYTLSSLTTALNSAGDSIFAGLIAAATIVDTNDGSDPLIIDRIRVGRVDFGAAASGLITVFPIVKDFSRLPGGGLLVAPSPLYLCVEGSGVATVATCRIRMFYTYLELATDEYWQLVESRRVITGV